MEQVDPIFSEQEQKENEERKEALCKILAAKEAILMVGAGVSSLTGYPTWSGLLQIFETELRDHADSNGLELTFRFREQADSESDLNYASRLKQEIGEHRFNFKIHQTFDRQLPILPAHEQLLSLPFQAILTTNYDRLLERTLLRLQKGQNNSIILAEETARPEIYKFLRALNVASDPTDNKVVHLHGELNHPASIVICTEDYERKYGLRLAKPAEGLIEQLTNEGIPNSTEGLNKLLNDYGLNWTLHRRIAWALMATRRLFYVGFSMSDPYFQMMHQIVSDDIAAYESESHYIALRITRETKAETLRFAKKIKRDYGIETVFFPDDNNYKGVAVFIDEIYNRCGNNDKPSQEKDIQAHTPDEEGSDEITKEVFQKSLEQNLDED